MKIQADVRSALHLQAAQFLYLNRIWPVTSESYFFPISVKAKIKMSENAEITPVKFTVTHYCLPQHTHEASIDWIVKQHLPLAIPVFKKYGVIDYSLVRRLSRNLLSLNIP